MKCEFKRLTTQGVKDNDGLDVYVVTIDEVIVLNLCDGDVEDNSLSKNFNDIYNLPNLFQMVYKAALKGDQLQLLSVSVDDI